MKKAMLAEKALLAIIVLGLLVIGFGLLTPSGDTTPTVASQTEARCSGLFVIGSCNIEETITYVQPEQGPDIKQLAVVGVVGLVVGALGLVMLAKVVSG